MGSYIGWVDTVGVRGFVEKDLQDVAVVPKETAGTVGHKKIPRTKREIKREPTLHI